MIKLLDEAADIDHLLMGELKKKKNQKNPNKAETYGKTLCAGVLTLKILSTAMIDFVFAWST